MAESTNELGPDSPDEASGSLSENISELFAQFGEAQGFGEGLDAAEKAGGSSAEMGDAASNSDLFERIDGAEGTDEIYAILSEGEDAPLGSLNAVVEDVVSASPFSAVLEADGVEGIGDVFEAFDNGDNPFAALFENGNPIGEFLNDGNTFQPLEDFGSMDGTPSETTDQTEGSREIMADTTENMDEASAVMPVEDTTWMDRDETEAGAPGQSAGGGMGGAGGMGDQDLDALIGQSPFGRLLDIDGVDGAEDIFGDIGGMGGDTEENPFGDLDVSQGENPFSGLGGGQGGNPFAGGQGGSGGQGGNPFGGDQGGQGDNPFAGGERGDDAPQDDREDKTDGSDGEYAYDFSAFEGAMTGMSDKDDEIDVAVVGGPEAGEDEVVVTGGDAAEVSDAGADGELDFSQSPFGDLIGLPGIDSAEDIFGESDDEGGNPFAGGSDGEAGGNPFAGGSDGEEGGNPFAGGSDDEAGGNPFAGGSDGEAGGNPFAGGSDDEAGGNPFAGGGDTSFGGGNPFGGGQGSGEGIPEGGDSRPDRDDAPDDYEWDFSAFEGGYSWDFSSADGGATQDGGFDAAVVGGPEAGEGEVVVTGGERPRDDGADDQGGNPFGGDGGQGGNPFGGGDQGGNPFGGGNGPSTIGNDDQGVVTASFGETVTLDGGNKAYVVIFEGDSAEDMADSKVEITGGNNQFVVLFDHSDDPSTAEGAPAGEMPAMEETEGNGAAYGPFSAAGDTFYFGESSEPVEIEEDGDTVEILGGNNAYVVEFRGQKEDDWGDHIVEISGGNNQGVIVIDNDGSDGFGLFEGEADADNFGGIVAEDSMIPTDADMLDGPTDGAMLAGAPVDPDLVGGDAYRGDPPL